MHGKRLLQLVLMRIEGPGMHVMMRPMLDLLCLHRFGFQDDRDVPLDRGGRLQHLQIRFFSAHHPPPATLLPGPAFP
ncbi:hypothetical protein D3C71_2055230 [compost metagenome]